MKGNKLLNRQQNKFLLYNISAILALFLLLGLIVVVAIETFFYDEADKVLLSSQDSLLSNKGPAVKFNPRVSYLLYDEEKVLFYADIPDFVNYSGLAAPEDQQRIYNRNLDGFNYRILEFKFVENNSGTEFYGRILINIDGEIGLRNTIVTIYFTVLGAVIILMLVTSYLLSIVTMRPVKKAMEAQALFVSDASHELRTPLTVLHSRLEQMLAHPDKKIIDKSEEISDCLSEVMRLTKLTDSLLTLSKSDADKLLPEMSEFDVLEAINKVALPYAETAATQKKEFIINGSPCIITADRKKIMQVLIILLDNALKYTDSGDKIKITVLQIKNKCAITVADTGIGISEDGLTKIFQRFYRDDASRGKAEGNGLGLAIAKQIIEEEHKGSIYARINTPKGTKFTVLLPCEDKTGAQNKT